jgi:exodeoxyribonuclease VII small subunit
MAASEKIEKDAEQQPPSPNERFDEILTRLRGVVERLEGGNLSLEDSLKFFEEGIGLCRRGASILDSAERKVEVLLGGSATVAGPGGRDGISESTAAHRTVPFDVPSGDED